MQEEKDLNNGNDHYKFMSPSVPKQQEENTSENTIDITEESHPTSVKSSNTIDNITSEIEKIVYSQQQDYQNKYSNQPYQNDQANNQAYRSIATETNISGLMGLVFAIFAWVILIFPIIAPLFWLLGLICSSIGMFKKPRGLATAGLVISLVGLLIGIILIALILSTGRVHAIQNI